MRQALMISSSLVCVALLGACDRSDDPGMNRNDHAAMPEAPRPAIPAPAAQVRVQLNATQGNQTTGQLMLTAAGNGVHITGEVTGLPSSGEFGFHIHEKGDCSAPDASSAGEHFNPHDQPHGNPQSPPHHSGDLPNLSADDDGVAQVDVVSVNNTLGDGGAQDVQGRAIVVHAQPDDYETQPSGDSGDRLACGVIGPAQASVGP